MCIIRYDCYDVMVMILTTSCSNYSFIKEINRNPIQSMFASKNSGASTDHDHSTNSVSVIIHRDKLFSAVFYGA